MPSKLKLESFVGGVPDEVICGHCHKVLSSPVALNCGHALCKSCLLRRTSSNLLYCPVCSLELQEDSKESSDRIRNVINELHVQCPRNCGETSKYGELIIHLNNKCPLGKVICTNIGCHRKIRRKELQEHFNVCDFKITLCGGCNKSLKLVDLRQHQQVHNCVNQQQKQMIVKNLREGEKEVKKHIEILKKDSFKIQRQTRDLEKDYIWKRIERNPGSFSPTLVQRHLSGSHLSLVPCSRPISSSSEEAKQLKSANKEGLERKKRAKSAGAHTFLICCQCNSKFLEKTNNEDACTSHAGPILNVFGGMCQSCGRLDSLEGCVRRKHIAS